jgi:hypothetical protein
MRIVAVPCDALDVAPFAAWTGRMQAGEGADRDDARGGVTLTCATIRTHLYAKNPPPKGRARA